MNFLFNNIYSFNKKIKIKLFYLKKFRISKIIFVLKNENNNTILIFNSHK